MNQDLFDPVKSRFVPPWSDSMMPVLKDPLTPGQGGSGGESMDQELRPVQTSSSQDSQSMASTSQMQEEMRKLIDAARSAVADLQAAMSPRGPQSPASAEPMPPPGIAEPAPTASKPQAPQEMGQPIDAASAAITELRVDDPAHGGASPGSKASKRRSLRQRT